MCYCFWNSGGLRNLSSGMHAYMAGMSPSNPSLQLQDFEGCFLLEFKLEKYFKLYSWSLLFIISILKFVKLTLIFFFWNHQKHPHLQKFQIRSLYTLFSVNKSWKKNEIFCHCLWIFFGGGYSFYFFYSFSLETFNDGICSLATSHMHMYVLFTPPLSLLVLPPLLLSHYMCLFYTLCLFVVLWHSDFNQEHPSGH